MRRGHQHYEEAFGDYLRGVGRPYVAVDDAKKAVFAGAQVKSFDFLVYSSGPCNWLVDVKGRKLTLGAPDRRGHLENWTTREDVTGLQQWARVFGDGFSGLLVFAYWLTAPQHGQPCPATPHLFGGRHYLLSAVPVEQYASRLRDRSRRWGTVSVPARAFREMLQPIDGLL